LNFIEKNPIRTNIPTRVSLILIRKLKIEPNNIFLLNHRRRGY
jgi:hypothetical protein